MTTAGAWAITQAQASVWKATPRARERYAEQARKAVEEQLESAPDDPHAARRCAASRWRISGRKDEAIREGERGVALGGPSRGRAERPVLPAPARPDLHRCRRAREGARPPRGAAEDPVLPLARLAEDRPQLRPAAQEPAFPEARRGRQVTLAAGTRLGSYEIVAPLGAGGMGEVYRARDSKLKREVAVKVLPQSLAADPDALARFEREALAVAALSHPNILAIFDFGTQDGDGLRRDGASRRRDAAGQARHGPDRAEAGHRLRAPGRERPLGGPREGHRPPGPEAGEPVRLEGRPSQDPRLRAGEESRDRHSGGEDERADGRGPHGSRDGDGHDGLHVARAGAGTARRSPLGPLLARDDPLRDALGQEGVQAGHGERHDRRDPEGGSAGADAVGSERLAGSRPHRQALPGEGPEPAVPVRAGHRLRALGDVVSDDSDERRAARGTADQQEEGSRSPLRRRSSFSPLSACSFCDVRALAAERPAASSASPSCPSRTSEPPRTTTSPTASRMPCAAS